MKGSISRPLRLFYALCCLLLICGIIQLSSKSIVLILFVVINIVLPYYLLSSKSRQRFMLTGFSVSAMVVVAVLSLSTFRERYVKLFKDDLSTDKTELRNSDTRLERWRVAAERIKAKPLLGYGSGSEIGLLKDDFYNAKLYSSYLHGLNAHNEYISLLIKSGLWGLLLYLLTLIYGFKACIKKRDVVFTGFMLVIAVVSFSENILDVDKGVMFYSFFFSFFIFSEPENEEIIIGKTTTDDYLSSMATKPLPLTSY
jgi:O-antigen ligase